MSLVRAAVFKLPRRQVLGARGKGYVPAGDAEERHNWLQVVVSFSIFVAVVSHSFSKYRPECSQRK